MDVASPGLVKWVEARWRFDEHIGDVHPYRIVLADEGATRRRVPAGCGSAVEGESVFPTHSGSTHSGSTHSGSTRPDDEANWAHGEPVEAALPGGVTLRGRRLGDEWRFEAAGASVIARVTAESARIQLLDRPAMSVDRHSVAPSRAIGDSDAAPDVRLILYLCISEAIRASGLLPLHAAVVVRDGWATALAAPSGTGKSTTLLRCLSRGWNPLAEDLAWLDPTTLRVYGWDRGVRLWDDGVRRLPSPWREAPWRVDPDGKRFLPWSEVRPERLPSARLEKIVLLERSGDDDGAGPPRLPPHEAVRVAWEAAGVPLNERARSASNAAIQLLLQQVEFERLTIEGGSPLSFSVPLL